MFSINQIKAAHSKVKSGADFPQYIQDIITLGVTGYSTYVTDGHTVYSGKNEFAISTDAKYSALYISGNSDSEKFKNYLKKHQQGQSDFGAFCAQCAETGVEKWIVDNTTMTCIYYDTTGNEMLVEKIPMP